MAIKSLRKPAPACPAAPAEVPLLISGSGVAEEPVVPVDKSTVVLPRTPRRELFGEFVKPRRFSFFSR